MQPPEQSAHEAIILGSYLESASGDHANQAGGQDSKALHAKDGRNHGPPPPLAGVLGREAPHQGVVTPNSHASYETVEAENCHDAYACVAVVNLTCEFLTLLSMDTVVKSIDTCAHTDPYARAHAPRLTHKHTRVRADAHTHTCTHTRVHMRRADAHTDTRKPGRELSSVDPKRGHQRRNSCQELTTICRTKPVYFIKRRRIEPDCQTLTSLEIF